MHRNVIPLVSTLPNCEKIDEHKSAQNLDFTSPNNTGRVNLLQQQQFYNTRFGNIDQLTGLPISL